ncbi:hypothetical protein [Bacillus sp. T33-2]|uniref:hypothetical protein n=1 Tax=Bacillus sp. T33-2 TaxID=2054168 RepID=UPI000C762E6B|nr:hypothetical protein [Bacillus sp. T33-2]PLR99643.1 hypothetical protein CVD19_00865 [Bacillus sp. T33-2]
MSYLNVYRQRLQASGNNATDGIVNSSKQTIKNNFSNSLFSETVLIDAVEYEVIVTQEKKSEDKKILLKPDTQIYVGSVVKIKNSHYLTMDFLGEGINEIYPTASLKLCNSSLPIVSNKTRDLLRDENGNPVLDDDGRPQYVETGGETIPEPCIVENKVSTGKDNEQLPLPEGRINVTLKYQVSDSLKVNSEFILYGNTYKILDIDMTKVIGDKGIILLNAERVVSS